ncbi:MAG: ATP-binding protein [Patescibacteria group bacterium]|jgi:signal transduction histidine kinase
MNKERRVKLLHYIIASRWVLHALFAILGLIQQIAGVVHFNPIIFVLLLVSYSYNAIFYFYLRRPLKQITNRGLQIVCITQIMLDQILYTIVLYMTGGIESYTFLFYFVTLFMAIILFNEIQIIGLMLFTVFLYIGLLILEHSTVLPHLTPYNYDPGFFGNITATVNNGSTVVFTLICISFFSAFINNLIKQREAAIESERDKVVSIVNNLVDGVILLDYRGRVVLMNPYAQRLLHIHTNQYVNKIFLPNQFPPALHDLVKFIRGATKGSVYESTEMIIQEGDEHVIVQATALQVSDSDGSNIGALVILRNITKEKDLDQMKSDFISVAAHQLRTPLSTLKWLFKLLLDGDGGPMTDKQQDLIAKGYQRNEEVIEIVNNLLDVSEIEGGRLPLTFVDTSLLDVLQEIVTATRVHAERLQVMIEFTPPSSIPLLKLDRQKIKMAFQNLLDNAVKYSSATQVVTITMELQREEVVVRVIDHGIGMSEITRDKLYTKFFRGREAVIKDPSGSGLGLYIVKSIIEKHGGTIELISAIGRGSTFTVKLPIT